MEGVPRHQVLEWMAVRRDPLTQRPRQSLLVIGRPFQKGKLLMLHAFGSAARCRPGLIVAEQTWSRHRRYQIGCFEQSKAAALVAVDTCCRPASCRHT